MLRKHYYYNNIIFYIGTIHNINFFFFLYNFKQQLIINYLYYILKCVIYFVFINLLFDIMNTF